VDPVGRAQGPSEDCVLRPVGRRPRCALWLWALVPPAPVLIVHGGGSRTRLPYGFYVLVRRGDRHLRWAVVHKLKHLGTVHHTLRFPLGSDLIPPSDPPRRTSFRPGPVGSWRPGDTALSLEHWTIGLALISMPRGRRARGFEAAVLSAVRRRRTSHPLEGPPPRRAATLPGLGGRHAPDNTPGRGDFHIPKSPTVPITQSEGTNPHLTRRARICGSEARSYSFPIITLVRGPRRVDRSHPRGRSRRARPPVPAAETVGTRIV